MSTNITEINSETNVTGHITAPRIRLGTDSCGFEIEYHNDDSTIPPEMYVYIPNRYRGKTVTQKYRMRSIIESIQELNRRTATINCTYTLDQAKAAFDTNINDPYDQFEHNETEDGLPAASGYGSINDLTDLFKIQIVQDGNVIADTGETMYPLNDILQWDTFIASNTSFNAFLEANEITSTGLTASTISDVDHIKEIVTINYTLPPINAVTCMS